MRYILIFTLSILLGSSCTVTSSPHNSAPSVTKEISNEDLKIEIFNGVDSKEINAKKSPHISDHGITKGFFGIIFYSKNGYHPESNLFKSMGGPVEIKIISLQKIEKFETGILTGAVFNSVSGGKVVEYSGISKIYRNEHIEITNDNVSFSAITDKDGVYRIALPRGAYRVSTKNTEMKNVTIETGKTSILNILKNITLVD